MQIEAATAPAPRWIGPAWALVALFVWSGTMIVQARLVGTITPATLSCVRFAVAALAIGLLLAARRQMPAWQRIGRADGTLLALAAAGLAANYVLSFAALSHVTPTEASVLTLMNGMLLLAAGVLVLHERLSRPQAIGLAVFGLGLALFMLPRLAGSRLDVRFATGTALVALSAVAWLVYALVQRVVQTRLSSQQVLWLVCCGAALLLLPLSSTQGFDRLDAGGWFALLLACLSTVVAYSAFALAMQHWTLSGATVVTSMAPVVVWVMSLLAVGLGVAGVKVPQVGVLGVLGAVLAVAGCAFAARGPSAARGPR